MSRKVNTLKILISNIVSLIIITLLNFVVRKVLLDYFTISYFGLNSLCNQLIGMLSLAELGVGAALTYSLYKPIAENNIGVLKSLIDLYKKFYAYIALTVAIIGVILSFFLSSFVKNSLPNEVIYPVFYLWLLNSVITYLIGYKRVLLFAHQKEYKTIIVDSILKIISLIIQLVIVIFTQNFLLFVSVVVVFSVLGNIIISVIVNRDYSYVFAADKLSLPKSYISSIKKNTKAVFLHKIGDFAIRSSDSLILSYIMTLSVVGIYSNYILIIGVVSNLLIKVFNSATASIGNLLCTDENGTSYKLYRFFHFINYILVTFLLLGFYFSINPFIVLWIGDEFLLSEFDIALMCIFYFLQFMRFSLGSFKVAGGIYDQDKFLPLIEAFVAIGLSLILVPKFNVAGLLIAKILSSLVVPFWSRPYYVYKYVFNRHIKEYFIELLKYFLSFLFVGIIIYIILGHITLNYSLMNLLYTIIIVVVITTLVNLCIYHKKLRLLFNIFK